MTAIQSIEHVEHATHAAEHGAKNAALLVAILAACLALTEVQAKHAEMQVEESSISVADSWNQYQAKSIRQAVSRDLQHLAATMDAPASPDLATRRQELLAGLQSEQDHYESSPTDGKRVITQRAHGFEHERDHARERAHAFDNAAAAFELGIVLATASAITSSKMLIRFAAGLGLAGILLGVLGFTEPSWGAF